MAQMIFVNLPVADLARARAFFAALGWRFDERFCDETAAMVAVGDSDAIHAMLLTHAKFREFTAKAIADTRSSTEVLLATSRDSREDVDALLGKALAAGASEPRPAQDYGFMYQRTFEDPDGHTWEVAWMDVEAAMAGARLRRPRDGRDAARHRGDAEDVEDRRRGGGGRAPGLSQAPTRAAIRRSASS